MSQHAKPTADVLNPAAQAVLITPLRDNIIILHNHVLFTGKEKRQSHAFLVANRNNYARLLAWHARLTQLLQEREDILQHEHHEAQHDDE